MNTPQYTQHGTKRTNQQWVAMLTGQLGESPQREAIQDLSHYLYILAYNRLCRRHNDVAYLSNLAPSELEQYARDFVQDTLIKLTENEYRRIEQYRGEGAFTSWVAQIIINRIRDELRCASWHRRTRSADQIQYVRDASVDGNPEKQAIGRAIRERVQTHVARLSPKSRSAVTRCVIGGEPVSDVAAELGISTNALYIQICRGRESLRKALRHEGLAPGV